MSTKPVHLHKNRHNTEITILLMLLPALVFAIVLAIFFVNNNKTRLSQVEENTAVLGGETEFLDSTPSP